MTKSVHPHIVIEITGYVKPLGSGDWPDEMVRIIKQHPIGRIMKHCPKKPGVKYKFIATAKKPVAEVEWFNLAQCLSCYRQSEVIDNRKAPDS